MSSIWHQISLEGCAMHRNNLCLKCKSFYYKASSRMLRVLIKCDALTFCQLVLTKVEMLYLFILLFN